MPDHMKSEVTEAAQVFPDWHHSLPIIDCWREGLESWFACADERAGLFWIAAPGTGALRKVVGGIGIVGRVRE
jgi:hypothetical protein